MNKTLLYINYIGLGFLILITAFTFFDTAVMYKKYGFSYDVTTTINGKSGTKTVTIWEKLISAIIFLCFCVVLLLDIVNLNIER